MSNVRLRRLGADFEKLKEYVRRHPRVRLIQTHGDPPERYQLEYRISSLRMAHGELQPVDTHLVEVTLPLNYPRTPPQCRMLSPVFHPNIAPHAICVGDHWSAGESLQSIITRIGEMLAYQTYNVKSPLNGEAARWVEENKHRVPLDPVSMLVEERQVEQAASPVVPPPPPPESVAPVQPTIAASVPAPQAPAPPKTEPASTNGSPPPQFGQVACPSCGTSYRRTASIAGKKVRCTKCESVFQVPAT